MHVPKLTVERGSYYILMSAMLWGSAVFTMFALVAYLKAYMIIPQQWFENLIACGRTFKISKTTGNYKVGKNAFMMPEGQKIGNPFMLWGAYVGLVLYRLTGRGRSPFNHFS